MERGRGYTPDGAAKFQRDNAMSLAHARENTAGRVHEVTVFEAGMAAKAAGHIEKSGILG